MEKNQFFQKTWILWFDWTLGVVKTVDLVTRTVSNPLTQFKNYQYGYRTVCKTDTQDQVASNKSFSIPKCKWILSRKVWIVSENILYTCGCLMFVLCRIEFTKIVRCGCEYVCPSVHMRVCIRSASVCSQHWTLKHAGGPLQWPTKIHTKQILSSEWIE